MHMGICTHILISLINFEFCIMMIIDLSQSNISDCPDELKHVDYDFSFLLNIWQSNKNKIKFC